MTKTIAMSPPKKTKQENKIAAPTKLPMPPLESPTCQSLRIAEHILLLLLVTVDNACKENIITCAIEKFDNDNDDDYINDSDDIAIEATVLPSTTTAPVYTPNAMTNNKVTFATEALETRTEHCGQATKEQMTEGVACKQAFYWDKVLMRYLTKEPEDQYNKLVTHHEVFLSHSIDPAQASRNIHDFDVL
jgi:hypothetical protein